MEFVYVYWTDANGKHYSVSGQLALTKYGAKPNKTHWEGRSYGIPIYNNNQAVRGDTTIKKHINEFLTLARKYTNTMFVVAHCSSTKLVPLSLLYAPDNVICNPMLFALLEDEEIP